MVPKNTIIFTQVVATASSSFPENRVIKPCIKFPVKINPELLFNKTCIKNINGMYGPI